MTAGWVTAFTLLAVAVAVQSLLILGLLRRAIPVLQRAERILATDPLSPDSGLHVGSTVADFTLVDNQGCAWALGELLSHDVTSFLFVAADCPSCARLQAELEEAQPNELTSLAVIISAGEQEASSEHGIRVFAQRDGSATHAFRQTAFPQCFVVDAVDRTVLAREFPHQLDDLMHMMRRAPQRSKNSSGRNRPDHYRVS